MKQRETTKSRRFHSKPIAAFGAAMSTLAVTQAPPAQAAIIDLSINPASVPNREASPSLHAPWSTNVFDFTQNNNGGGKTLSGGRFLLAGPSFTVTTGQTFVTTFPISTIGPNASLVSGTHTFGFKTNLNQVGWIRINMNGQGNPIFYLAAAYNDTPGGSIHVPIPEPASVTLAALGALAAGASEIRRRRRAYAAAV